MGKTVEYDVEIRENPVESIEVVESRDVIKDLELVEGSTGTNTYEYYEYGYSDINVKINYKDGTSLYSNYNGTVSDEYSSQFKKYESVGWVNTDIMISASSKSSAQNQNWTVGGNNEVAVSYLGVTTTHNANLIENPVEKVLMTKSPTPVFSFFTDGWEARKNEDSLCEYIMTCNKFDGVEMEIHYKDGTTKTYTDEDVRVCEYFYGSSNFFKSDINALRIYIGDYRVYSTKISVNNFGKINNTFEYLGEIFEYQVELKDFDSRMNIAKNPEDNLLYAYANLGKWGIARADFFTGFLPNDDGLWYVEDGRVMVDTTGEIYDPESEENKNVVNGKVVDVIDPNKWTPISTKEELAAMADDMRGKYYLTNDIIFTDADFEEGGAFYNDGKGWIPIGTEDRFFNGKFDGRGYTIQNLTINIDGDPDPLVAPLYLGLFGYAKSSEFKNVGMIDTNISADVDKATVCAGAICGSTSISNAGIIENCYNTGDIIVTAASNDLAGKVGGLFGTVTGNDDIEFSNCYNTGDITGNYDVGGIAGHASRFNVKNCYNAGNISGGNYVGGIVGENMTVMRNCYNVGTVVSEGKAGGIVGHNLCSSSSLKGDVADCYYLDVNTYAAGKTDWLTETVYASTKATKCTDEQMKNQATFETFDFDAVWTMAGSEEYLYPELRDVPMVELDKVEVMSSLTSKPTKLEYVQGKDALDLSGGKITIYYNTGETEVVDLSEAVVTGFDNSKLGTQTLTVEYGMSTFTFEVTVVEAPPEPPVVTEPTEIEIRDNSPLKVNAVQNCITGIQPSTTVAGLKVNLENDSTKIRVVNSRGGNINRTVLATGDKVQLISGGRVLDEMTIVVLGDVSGEGKINVQDVKKVLNDSINKANLSGAYALAADVNGNGKVDVPDVKKVLNVSIGKASSF